jgi:type IX secretion system PorP/SprF family membrane protein
MKQKIYTALVWFLAITAVRAQQQTLFTNILLHPYLYNPAYAGAGKTMEFNMNYRHQWTGFDGAPKTFAFSGYSTFKKHLSMAAGGMITYDQAGLLGRTSFYGSYSYHLKLGDKMNIGFGLSMGGVQYNVKVYQAKPYPDDKDDAFLRSDILNALAFDANAGLYLYSKNFFFGFSNQQMANAKIHWDNTQGRLTPHYFVNSGYTFRLGEKKSFGIQPSALARFSSPHPYQLEYSLRLIYKDMVWLGATYRSNSSLSGLFGVTISEQWSIGYSYDYTLNALSNYNTGSHEIVLRYSRPVKRKRSASEQVQDADEEELNKIDNSIKTNLKNKKSEEKK